MKEYGVIEKVTLPTNWCAPMEPVMKTTGILRIRVGLKKLIERYQMPTTDWTLAKLS